jgi:tellurium resistance protein TerD
MQDDDEIDDLNNYAPANVVEEQPEILYTDEPRNKIKRGQELNLTEKDPALRELTVGVGWDLKAFESDPLDLDASVFLLNNHDKTRIDEDFIFYNNMKDRDGAVVHQGDSRTGAGEGDDEIINIDLTMLSYDVLKIAFVLSIYDMDYKNHDFSMVKNVYFRVVNQNTQHEIFRYELDEELAEHEGLLIGYLERIGAEWIFRAVGDTIEGGLNKIAHEYGIIVAENMY